MMKQPMIIPMLKFDNTNLPFKIQTLPEIAEQPDELCGSVHRHDHYEIVWVTNGKGTLTADLQDHVIEKDMIFFFKPNQPHGIQMDPGTEGFVFTFTDAFFNLGEHEFDVEGQVSIYHLFNKCRPINMQKAIGEEVRDISLKMIREYENQYQFRSLLLKRYFRIFLILLSRQLEEVEESAEHTKECELVKRFLQLLDKNFREEKMVSAYAAQLSVTANYLNKIVKKKTGYAAGNHIRQRIVLEAKRMARYSTSGMKEIAYELGFFDSAHFSRFFKTIAGINFTDFKRETLKYSINPSFRRAS